MINQNSNAKYYWAVLDACLTIIYVWFQPRLCFFCLFAGFVRGRMEISLDLPFSPLVAEYSERFIVPCEVTNYICVQEKYKNFNVTAV